LLGIAVGSVQSARAVGQNGVILQTVNGGERWYQDLSGTTTTLNSVFTVGDECWTVGRDGVILRYTGSAAGRVRTILR
ncbi:MAG: hypothetical protein EBU88_20115, partial [Acidobacteria bacterium]|nr:hypothetical protein [Acidobacteriota bacterium]